MVKSPVQRARQVHILTKISLPPPHPDSDHSRGAVFSFYIIRALKIRRRPSGIYGIIRLPETTCRSAYRYRVIYIYNIVSRPTGSRPDGSRGFTVEPYTYVRTVYVCRQIRTKNNKKSFHAGFRLINGFRFWDSNVIKKKI